MKKKVSTFLIFALSILLIFSGCSSGSKSDTMNYTQTTTAASYAESGEGVSSAESSYDSERSTFDEDGYTENTGEFEKKVIKNGNISVVAKDVDQAYSGILEIVLEIGGEEFNKNYSIYDSFKRIELVIKIPPENLELFQEKLKSFVGPGKIRNINIRSSDITSEYYDISARLESYKASRDQMLELLKDAQNIDETLRIQYEITRLQADIDSMQGQVRMWDSLISMSTITLIIEQEDNPFKTNDVSWKFNSYEEIGRTMKNGFIAVINNVYSLILWIVVGIVSFSPVILAAGAGLFIYFKVKKKRKKQHDKTEE